MVGAATLPGNHGTALAANQTSAAPVRGGRRHLILMSGYGPATTGFSQALKRIGERLTARFADAVDVKFVYNILDLGYRADDIVWLVEQGVLTLGYQSSSYLTDRVRDLSAVDLPFLFPDLQRARSSMDGRLGQLLAARIEAAMNYRVLGWFENGFRFVSNRLRPVRVPADLKGMTIRVLPSKVQARTFELLGAVPKIMDLSEAIAAIKAGSIDAQENPYANTVTYGVHNFHRFHTATNHFYISRPIFVHRPTFDAWPRALQEEMRAAVHEAMQFQRELHVREETEAMAAIVAAGGTILDLTAGEHAQFASAVKPLYGEVRGSYSREVRRLLEL